MNPGKHGGAALDEGQCSPDASQLPVDASTGSQRPLLVPRTSFVVAQVRRDRLRQLQEVEGGDAAVRELLRSPRIGRLGSVVSGWRCLRDQQRLLQRRLAKSDAPPPRDPVQRPPCHRELLPGWGDTPRLTLVARSLHLHCRPLPDVEAIVGQELRGQRACPVPLPHLLPIPGQLAHVPRRPWACHLPRVQPAACRCKVTELERLIKPLLGLLVGRLRATGLTIKDLKTSYSRRKIELSDIAVEALRRHRALLAQERLALGEAWQDNDLVFPNTVGNPTDAPGLLERGYARLIKAAGLPYIRFHDLRHTAATLLLLKGVHPKKVSEMLGHATVGITLNTYSHVLPSLGRDAASAMDALLGPSETAVSRHVLVD